MPGLALAACAILATVVCEIVLMHRQHYMRWFVPVLVAGAAVGIAAILLAGLLRRPGATAVAIGGLVLLLLVVPTGYASSTWLAPVESTFPAAGPKQTAGQGGVGVNARDLAINRALADYVQSHRPGSRFPLLTVAADTAAPLILLGTHAAGAGRLQRRRPGARRRGAGTPGRTARSALRAARGRVLDAGRQPRHPGGAAGLP